MDPPGKVVRLGKLCIGQTVKKIVTIANNSAAPLAFKLRVTSTVPELQEAGVRPLRSLQSTLVCLQGALSCCGWELVGNDSSGLPWLPVPALSSVPALLCQQILAV